MIIRNGKRVSVLLAIFLILAPIDISYAASAIVREQIDVQPCWSNTSSMVIDLSINGGKAVLSAFVEGHSGVTRITAVARLDRYNNDGTYTEIETWDGIYANDEWLDWTSTRYVTKGYIYRFTFTATVYKNGIGETVSGSKSMPA